MNDWVPPARWPIVGREQELKDISSAWARRACRGVVIAGPAGIGKSVLAETCFRQALSMGFRGARATATVAARAVPLGAISHTLPHWIDGKNPEGGIEALAADITRNPARKQVYLIDDLHLLDETSAVLLSKLLASGTVRLISTLRTGEPLGPAVGDLVITKELHKVEPAALALSKVGDLLQRVLGGRPSERTVHDLHTASDGNPLFIRELALGALSAGSLRQNSGIWELDGSTHLGTPKLNEVIKVRVEKAGPECQSLLHVLALCEPLPQVAVHDYAAADVVSSLVVQGLIRVTHSGDRSEISLAHPLYGEVLRNSISPLRRRILLQKEIDRVEACGTRRREDALRVATWRLEAFGTADGPLLVRAAQLARRAHDYSQVISLLDAIPDTEHSTATRLLYGEALVELARWRDAEAAFIRAAECAESDTEKLNIAVARTMNMLWSNANSIDAIRINDVARVELTDARSQHTLTVNDAVIRTVSGEVVQGIKILSQDLGAAPDGLIDLNVWLTGAVMKGVGLAAMGQTETAVKWSQVAYQRHLAVNDDALVPHPASQQISTCFALAESGKLAESVEVGYQAFSDLITARAPLPRIWMAYFLGHAEWLSGHVRSARRWFAESISLSKAQKQNRALRLALSGMAAADAVLGKVDEARELEDEAQTYPAIGFMAGQHRLGEIWIHAAHGRLQQAREVLHDAISEAHVSGHQAAESLLLVDLARLGAPHQAAVLMREKSIWGDGSLASARSNFVVALENGDPSELERVGVECEALGAHLLAAESWLSAAGRWQKNGQPSKAGRAQERGQVVLGWCEGARTPLLSGVQITGALTKREHEIALMAASGTASKEIADELDLSVRTVNNHIQRIFAKLGISRRKDLNQYLRKP
ncbi:LuxR C-terminal-related transcriptional regulator [Streptomyces sp. NPDC086783]|uniref:LuxR C-terminal-related transcriptional regulator n=1 Tax=Streptomyces sp. NPDC086783 TaxID=3365758 RepID=UPI00381BFCD3